MSIRSRGLRHARPDRRLQDYRLGRAATLELAPRHPARARRLTVAAPPHEITIGRRNPWRGRGAFVGAGYEHGAGGRLPRTAAFGSTTPTTSRPSRLRMAAISRTLVEGT